MIWTSVSFGAIIGSDNQNFNAALTAEDYVTSQSARSLRPGKFSLGLFVNHARNTLPYFDQDPEDTSDSSQDVKDGLTSASLSLGYGVTKNWEVGIDLPHVIYQNVTNEDLHGQFKRRGLTGVRLHSKVGLFTKGYFSLATSGSAFFDLTKDNPYTNRNPSFALEIIPELDFGFIRTALNLGYRWRPQESQTGNGANVELVEPIENQVIASAAVAVPVFYKTELLAEIYGARTQSDFAADSARKATNSETVLGLKHEVSQDLVAQIGMGREIQHSLSSADLRAYAGIHWQLGPKVGKKRPKRLIAKPKKPRAPLPPPVPVEIPERVEILSDVLFDFDSDRIKSGRAHDELAKVARVARGAYGYARVVVEGHTCSLGTDDYNRKLSYRRARAVTNYLVDVFKVPRSKIEFYGLGESQPIASNLTEESRRFNRRVEFKIYHNKRISH